MMTRAFPWLVMASAVLLVACKPSKMDAALEGIESRLRAQEEAQRRMDQDMSKSLAALAERMERLADALMGANSVVAGKTKPDSAQRRHDSRADNPANGGLMHAPVSPARELEMQRRTTIWIAAFVATAIAFGAALRLRSRWKDDQNRVGEDSAAQGDIDAGAWEEASVLTDAVPPRAAPRGSAPTGGGASRLEDQEQDAQQQGQPADLSPSMAQAPAAATAQDLLTPGRCAFLLVVDRPQTALPAVESYLRHDPRVLQKPAAQVRLREGGLAVECSLLPGLPDGEREHLRAILQRLASDR